jgi:hypothetical protein
MWCKDCDLIDQVIILYRVWFGQFYRFDPDPTVRHTFWGYLIGNTLAWISTYGMTQASVQRMCAVKTMKEAKLWGSLLSIENQSKHNFSIHILSWTYFSAQIPFGHILVSLSVEHSHPYYEAVPIKSLAYYVREATVLVNPLLPCISVSSIAV